MSNERRERRIVYGANCTWWDSIDKSSQNSSGLPCCPNCDGVLFEISDINVWQKSVDEHAKTLPGYAELMAWARGRCFPTLKDLEKAYLVHRTIAERLSTDNNKVGKPLV